ncbi:MAG: hypothetical protein Q7S31_03985 [bacterium]|nr:hypothetical protein [bacterium]
MKPKLNIFWLILPSVVFILLVSLVVLRFSRRPENSTEAPAVSPTPIVYPAPTPISVQGLPSLVKQIDGWQANDPRLAPPVVDRKISLPEE